MSNPCAPPRRRLWDRVTLAQLQRIKRWREAQHGAHPLERQTWEAVLTLWMMGWVGWIPAFEFDMPWVYPLCLLGVLAPRLYVYWRLRSHEAGRLRCDWLHLL
ncbi:MAG: hypothetical protein JWR68_1498 [Polaromonas sp.]|nr:hypothetical protein [Polaromonas sp.]